MNRHGDFYIGVEDNTDKRNEKKETIFPVPTNDDYGVFDLCLRGERTGADCRARGTPE